MIRLMLVVVLPTILSFTVTIIAVAVVPLSNGSSNQTGFLYNVTNASTLGAIDPRFTTDYRQGQDRLSASSCLMNAVNAMMALALENFTEPVVPRNYMDADYPEVMIVPIALAQGQRIEARYLLWGIWEGIRWMVNHQSFRDLVIGVYWDGLLICNIWIRGARSQLSVTGGNVTLSLTARSERMSIHNSTVESTQGLSMMEVRNPLNDHHVTVAVTQVGETLGITEVFVTIFAALEYLAHFPGTDEVIRFQISPDDEDTTIGVLEHTRAPALGPPFLEYQWVTLSLGQIPAYMLQQRRFTEAVIEIAVDGVPLGEGFLHTGDLDENSQISSQKQTLGSTSKG